jgi:Spy/CpxP family protein refolding chaperone
VRRWWLALALFLSLGVNAGILATLGLQRWWAQRTPLGADDAGTAPGPHLARLADRLELEGEPRRRFVEIQRRFLGETLAERRRLERARAELRREILAPSPDRVRVEELVNAAAESTAILDRALARNILESREVLDEEQEQRFLRFVVGRLRQRRMHGGGLMPPRAQRELRREAPRADAPPRD